MPRTETITLHHKADEDEEELAHIRTALAGIRYGSVEVTIHDSRIVQIERKEKLRFD